MTQNLAWPEAESHCAQTPMSKYLLHLGCQRGISNLICQTPSSPSLPSPALPIAFPSQVRGTILPGPQTLLSLTSHIQFIRKSHPWALSSRYTPIPPLLITTTTTILVQTIIIPCLSSCYSLLTGLPISTSVHHWLCSQQSSQGDPLETEVGWRMTP